MRRPVASLLAVAALLVAAPRRARRRRRHRPLHPAARATTAGCPTTDELDRPAPALRRADAAARQRHRRGHRPATSCPRTSRRSARPTRSRPAGPGCDLIYDAYGDPAHLRPDPRRRRLRRRLGHGARPRAAAPARPRAGAGRRRRRARHRRVLARHERPVVRARAPRPRRSSRSSASSSSTTYGAKGRQIIADAQAYADGINAYWKAHGINQPPATVNDVIAVTAFIGSIFGAGGGGEATNADLLAKLQQAARPGAAATRRGTTSCSPTTPRRRPRSSSASTTRPLTGGRVTGSVVDRRRLDQASTRPRPTPRPTRRRPRPRSSASTSGRRARRASRRRTSSSSSPQRSATGNTLAVMGPQLGYYYPEIVQQMDLHGPGINAQGVGGARPGDVHPHRAHAGLRVEPHLGRPRRPRRVRRAALRARRLARRRARPTTTCFKGECRPFEDVRRRHAERHADPLPDARCTAR